MNEIFIKRALFWEFNNHDYRLFNVYVFGDEADFFCISKTGYATEFEIKVSKSDFKADFKKKKKHEKYADKSRTYKPNRFYYVVPDGLIDVKDVPTYAGLIYICESASAPMKYVKKAPLLHREKPMQNVKFVRELLSKFYYRYSDVMRKYEIPQWSVVFKQTKISFNYYQNI